MEWITIITIVIVVAIVIAVAYYFWGKRSCATSPPRVLANTVNGKIKIMWDAVVGVDSYIVFIGNKSGDYQTKIPTNKTEIEIDKKYCTKYYIAIKAITAGCESDFSNEVTVDTKLKEPSPIIVDKKGDILNVVLNTAIPGATEYIVKVGISPTNYEIEQRGKNTVFNIDVSKLPRCRDLYVTASAIGDGCQSDFSDYRIFKNSPPNATQIIEANKMPEGIHIKWSPVQDNMPIIYGVEYKKEGGQYVLAGKIDRPEYRLGLRECGTYYLRVQVYRSDGCNSEYSPEYKVNLPKPQRPGNVRAD